MVSLKQFRKSGGFFDFVPDETKPSFGGDDSIVEAATKIHELITGHVPLDCGADWGDVEDSLPRVAVRPKVGDESSGPRRQEILPVVRGKFLIQRA